jgi:hypothetical protein
MPDVMKRRWIPVRAMAIGALGRYVFRLGKDAPSWKIRAMTLETFYQTGNTKLLELAGGK